MQSKIHDKDAITILFILEMTSAAILTCTKRKSTLSYPYVHTLGSPRPHPLEKRLSLYFTPFLEKYRADDGWARIHSTLHGSNNAHNISK